MKTHELRNLQALRQLREQRAATQLLVEQRQCQERERELALAKQRLHRHREQLAREAQQAYAALADGLSVTQWHAAQSQLQGLSDEQSQLQTAADAMTRQHDQQLQRRDDCRVQHLARQRQCDAWDSVVEHRQRGELRAAEHREDADEGVQTPSAAGAN